MKKAALALLFSLFSLLILSALFLYTAIGGHVLQYGLRFVDGVSVERIEGSLADELSIANFSYTSDKLVLAVQHCRISWQPERLLESTLQIADLFAKDVVIQFKEGEPETKVVSDSSVTLPEISLPIGVLVNHLRVEDVWFQQKSPDSWMIRELDLEAEYDRHAYTIKHLHFDAPQAVFDLHGKLSTAQGWTIDMGGNWKLTFTGYSTMQGDIRAAGPLSELAVEANAAAPYTLSVNGVLKELLNDPQWTAKIYNGYGNLKDINQKWPDIELEHVAADAAGSFATYGGRVSGTASYWRAQGVSLIIDMLGDSKGIKFENIDGYLNGGHARVDGEIGWKNHFFWKGKGEVNRINPAEFVDHFDGAIDGTLLSEGEIGYGDADILHCFFDSRILSGNLQGYPVHGQGRIQLNGADVDFENIELFSEDSSVKMNGKLTENYGLDFSLHSPDIGHFVDSGSGALDVEGTLEGPKHNPLLDFQLAGEKIQYDTTTLAAIRGKGQIDLSPTGKINASIQAVDLVAGEMSIHRASIDSMGNVFDHCIQLSAESNFGDTQTQFCGKYENSSWIGDISKLNLNLQQYGNWQLNKPVNLAITGEKTELSMFCLVNSNGEVCGDFSWQKGLWASSLKTDNFDLRYIQGLAEIPYDYKGKAQVDITANGNRGKLNNGEVTLAVSDAEVTIPINGEHTKVVSFDSNTINAEIHDETIDVVINTRLSDGSSIAANLLGEGSVFESGRSLFEKRISGKVAIDLADMADLSFLTGYTVRPKGKMHGTVKLSGTLSEPVAEGVLRMEEGEVDVPSIGATFTNSTVSLEADREGVWINMITHAGEGAAVGAGYLLYEKGYDIIGRFSVKGEKLDLVYLPQYEITANPDVLFIFNNKSGHISGSVEIPQARIAPVHLASAVTESKDVVYVDGKEEEHTLTWPLDTDLRVKFGDNVVVNSFGLNGKVEGDVHVSGKPGENLTGRGELTVKDATFSIYRRVLDIERGRVQFSGGPIENPSLDIRAQKTVENNIAGRNGGWTVGVDVSGTVDDLNFDLFSSPVMSDSDILAYLIIGHSVETSNSEEDGLLMTAATALGIGATAEFMEEFGSIIPVDDVHLEGGTSTEDASIVVGKRLTDNLYIGYDYNFYQATSEFILRYNLGKGFYIETQSSSDANGADIFYSFEN